MVTLHLDLGERSYPVYIGQKLLSDKELLRRHLVANQVLVVTNDTIAPLYLAQVQQALTGLQAHELVLPDGEQYKDIPTWNSIFDALLTYRLQRTCTLIALGGGVIGDTVGFAAACYQRGVAFIQIPTTLMAQVDSAVGGKTAVNHPLGKNMIGAFHQPRCVIADTDTLNTLPDRELAAGIAEVIKYGVIRDYNFFTWLEANINLLLAKNPDALAYAIERSCRNKADIVAKDERELGRRAILNLGHTFGHAIETGVGYGNWLHGEAVGAGICMAANLACRLGLLDTESQNRIHNLIERAGLPTKPPATLPTKRFLELMAMDKKSRDGRIRLVLLTAIGKAMITDTFAAFHLQRMLDEYSSLPVRT